MAERADARWDRSVEPPARWRSLLDRALLGRANPSDLDYDGRFDRPRAPYPPARPYDDEPMHPNGTRPLADAPSQRRVVDPYESRRGPQVEYQARPVDPTEQMVQVLRQEIPTPKVLAFAKGEKTAAAESVGRAKNGQELRLHADNATPPGRYARGQLREALVNSGHRSAGGQSTTTSGRPLPATGPP